MKPNHEPLSAETHFTLGNEKNKAGDYKGAIADYNAAIRLKPDFARAYYNRGETKANWDGCRKQGQISKLQASLQNK